MKNLLCQLILCFTIFGLALSVGAKRDEDIFEPTNEWNEVLPGQSVPGGLEIRMDLQTGLKMARFVQEKNDQTSSKPANEPVTSLVHVPEEDTSELSPADKTTSDSPHVDSHDDASESPQRGEPQEFATLEAMLEWAIEHSDPDVLHASARALEAGNGTQAEGVADAASVGDLESRRHELQAYMNYLEEISPSDVDLMKNALEILTSGTSTEAEVFEAFDVLEELLHQFDNCGDFEQLGGLQILAHVFYTWQDTCANVESGDSPGCVSVSTIKFNPNPESDTWGLLRVPRQQAMVQSLWVTGIALQSHARAQNVASELGLLEFLVSIIISPSSPTDVTTKAIFALSSLVRANTENRQKFVEEDGLYQLVSFTYQQSFEETTPQQRRIQRKAVTFLYDLWMDSISMESMSEGDKSLASRVVAEYSSLTAVVPSMLMSEDLPLSEAVLDLTELMLTSESLRDGLLSSGLSQHMERFASEVNKLIADGSDIDDYLNDLLLRMSTFKVLMT
eukprot:Rmarinus@m.29650